VRITARRLAWIVFAASGLDVVGVYATSYILSERGPLALGFSGMFLPILLFLICPFLVLDAGVLALRRRAATNPEIAILGGLAGTVLLLGGMSALEPFLPDLPGISFYVIGTCLVAVCLAAVGSLVVIVIATIRAPRLEPTNAAATTNAPSGRADPTP
jgi:hypothetical protein